MAKPKVEQAFRFLGTPDPYDPKGPTKPLGVDSGALMPNTEVTVRELVAADEVGAHDDSEEAVVIEWDAPALVIGDDGALATGTVARAMSIGVSQFSKLFEAL